MTSEHGMSEASRPRPVIVVAGGTGSGKTTIVAAIERAVGPDRVAIIPHDAYYRDRPDLSPEQRAALNFDHPDSLETTLLLQHLERLARGQPIDLPVYDFVDHRRKTETVRVESREVIIVEGVLVLADAALRDRATFRVYVDTDDDLRFIRRLQRDVHERGRSVQSVIDQYLSTVRPMHLQFVEPSRRHADVIVPEGGYNSRAIEMICNQIRALAGMYTGRDSDAY
jgi:uridine kinase